jgi:hypothetical protein
MDAASHPSGEATPSPGDFTVCMYCNHLMAFANDMTLRELTGSEMVEAAGRLDLLRLQSAIHYAKSAKETKQADEDLLCCDCQQPIPFGQHCVVWGERGGAVTVRFVCLTCSENYKDISDEIKGTSDGRV